MSKRNKTKPRSERVLVTTKDVVDSISISVDHETGKIRLDKPVINSYSETAYEREKGEKIISKVPLSPEGLSADPDAAIAANFDAVFSVDTNTWSLDGREVSATGIVACRKIFIGTQGSPLEPVWRYHTPLCFAFTGPRDKPERAGWALAMGFVHNSSEYKEYSRIGIIVDHDLRELQEYNGRRCPIAGEEYLHERMSLVYASCDTGGEYFVTQMLRNADRAATLCLEKFADGTISFPPRQSHGMPFQSLLRIYGQEKNPKQ